MHLQLAKKGTDPVTVLCLGAHSDDIEIGCGGTLLHLKKTLPQVKFHWVVFSAAGIRGIEAAKAAELFGEGCAKDVILKDFRDGFLPYGGSAVKDFFEEIKSRVNPDIIFTHWRDDAGIRTIRLIAELTWNTFPQSSDSRI